MCKHCAECRGEQQVWLHRETKLQNLQFTTNYIRSQVQIRSDCIRSDRGAAHLMNSPMTPIEVMAANAVYE